MNENEKRFHVRKLTHAGFGELHEGEDVLGGAVSGDNVYIAAYSEQTKQFVDINGKVDGRASAMVLCTHDGKRVPAGELSTEHPRTLEVGQRAVRRYALSGSSGEYVIERVR